MTRLQHFRKWSGFLVLMVVMGFSSVGYSHETEEGVTTTAPDSLGRSTPRGAMLGYMEAVEANDYEKAATYLDLRNLSDEARELGGVELAKNLDIMLQRMGWNDVHGLSNHPDGSTGDNLPPYRELLARAKKDEKEYTLLLQKVPGGNGQSIWKISNATVSNIPELYSVFGYGVVVETVAEILPEVWFMGLPLFKWVLIFGMGILSAPFILGTAWAVARSTPIRDPDARERVKWFMTRPVTLLFVALVMRWTMEYVGVGLGAQKATAGWTLIILLATWVMLELVNLVRVIYSVKLEAKGRPDAVVLLKPAGSTAKVVIVILAVMLWLDNMGVDITTLLAGLGIGGVALALALQRPSEDFLAALTLFTQQPVRVGDFCKFGDQVGTIEEIGLRATRLRTLANTIVTLPNARFATEYIENISSRRKVLFNPRIRINYQASRASIEKALANIKQVLDDDDMVSAESLRVRFRTIANNAHEIEIFAYVMTTDWLEYLEIVERLNLGILDAVQQAGTSLAVPVQRLAVEQATPDQ